MEDETINRLTYLVESKKKHTINAYCALLAAVQACINETERRRRKQQAYNAEHGIVPKTIIKSVRDLIEISSDPMPKLKANGVKMTERERRELIASLEAQMKKAAQMLEYEIAAQLRDEIIRLRGK